jgi:hypothetical protein
MKDEVTGEFHEDFVSQHLDTLDGKREDFPFDAIDGFPEKLTDDQFDMVGRALSHVLRFVADVAIKPRAHELIGLRAVAALWVIRPDFFDGLSQAEIAELLGCKNRMDISRHASEFSKLFAIRNRGQSHGWNFQAEPIERRKQRGSENIPSK